MYDRHVATHSRTTAAEGDTCQLRAVTNSRLIVSVTVEDDVEVHRPRAPAPAGKVPPHHFLLSKHGQLTGSLTAPCTLLLAEGEHSARQQ